MSKYLFEDRRSVSDRRTGRERRCVLRNPAYIGIERRRLIERRSGAERRRWFRLFLKLGCKPLYPVITRRRAPEGQSIVH
jgi:hypothetical protein